ncbi:hypothetical protein P389DRAFT_62138 [Cystobasidium minutum MCA 4210]|uniref:uncharacterized protein n=1 Tax=Cystobasidium minutum MCA 4210 TaxID=1397322 RepID=UPI0034CE3837|eukprot:jgi/Rhomi1/62138/CE62137_584
MNYTSTRYDGPYGAKGRGGEPTHSASSSSSSYDGGNMAGVGSHAAGGGSSSGSGSYTHAMQYQHHHHHHHQYDSSGDYASPSSSNSGRMQGNNGPTMRAMVMQQQQQQQPQQYPSQLAYAAHHRQAQISDDYDNNAQYASYNAGYPERVGTPTGYSAATPRPDRENRDPRDNNDPDNSFDFLLSPGLAPVGPISTSSSFGNLPPPFAPPPTQPPPPLPSSNGLFSPATTPSRPMFNRSQTAMPAPSSSGRAFQAPPTYASHQQGSSFATEQGTSSLSSSIGQSAGQASSSQANNPSQQPGREYTPPPAITAKALLDIVLNLRADQPSTSQSTNSAAASSSSMSRSQSANATARLQQVSQVPAHMRNISTGSNRSDEDGGMTSSQTSNGLSVPSHPGMARTASSRNVTDNGQSNLRTIDLTHHRIAEVPTEVIDALEGTVRRLALGYNYIASLPPSFARLGNTLRYLNIRLNMLTTFPPVLCEMPSLEILDISRNKIKRLPPQCGTLKGLRVFSISKNRVKRLPTYFADMKQLRVLKIDHNPLEWPPRDITTQPTVTIAPAEGQSKREAEAVQAKQEAQALQKWLTNLQEWIRDHASEMAVPPIAGKYDDLDSSVASKPRPEPIHSQSDSNILRSARVEVTVPPDTPSAIPEAFSPHQSPTQDASLTAAKSPKDLPSIETNASRLSQHGRSESHSLAQAAAPRKGLLQSKKSLPDLRQNHAQILDERLNSIEEQSPQEQVPADRPKPRGPGRHFKTPSNASSAGYSPVTARPNEGLPTPPRSAGAERPEPSFNNQARRGEEDDDSLAPLPSPSVALSRGRKVINGKHNNAVHQSGAERGTSGAYFKRLSMLPPSTISKAVPPSLLQFIEGVRGIFFALSQIHTSLKNCLVSPAMDRLPAVFTKMMASADDAIGFLIDALDRFDSTTRRGLPETATVKDVIETCRENLTIFSKLVTIVLNQLKTLVTPTSDIRYIRTLVLGLYGGMGEIAVSWESLGPLHGEISRWLHGDKDLSPTSLQLQPPTPSEHEDTFTPGPLLQSSRPSSPVALRGNSSPKVTANGLPIPPSRTPLAKARRRAGSFSKYNQQLPPT